MFKIELTVKYQYPTSGGSGPLQKLETVDKKEVIYSQTPLSMSDIKKVVEPVGLYIYNPSIDIDSVIEFDKYTDGKYLLNGTVVNLDK